MKMTSPFRPARHSVSDIVAPLASITNELAGLVETNAQANEAALAQIGQIQQAVEDRNVEISKALRVKRSVEALLGE
jgi:phosphoribosyl-dephospho-CoA transferase